MIARPPRPQPRGALRAPPCPEISARTYASLPAEAKRFYDESRAADALRSADLRPEPEPGGESSYAVLLAVAVASIVALWIIAAVLEPALKRQSLATQEYFTAQPRALP